MSIVAKEKHPSLDELLERAVDGRADPASLIEFDGRNCTLADTLGGELEFLRLCVSIGAYR